MSQISIDDIAWEYQLDLPVVKPVIVPVQVGNDKQCAISPAGQVCIAANTYTMFCNPSDVPVVKAFLNNKAQQALAFAEHNQTVANMTPITYPQTGFGIPHSKVSSIQIGGMVGNTTLVSATLYGFTAADPSPPKLLNLVLQGPSLGGVQLMWQNGAPASYPAHSFDVSNLTLGFSDQAAAAICTGSGCTVPMVSGIYKPSGTNVNRAVPTTNPPTTTPPATPYTIVTSSLNGVSPNGTWILWGVNTSTFGGQMSITGWSLTVTTV